MKRVAMAGGSSSNELLYIYDILRRLKGIQSAGDETTTLRADIFPTTFLLKLLNERLIDLQELANQVVSTLLQEFAAAPQQVSPARPELDQFFFHALHHLHNFFLELNWHQANFADQLTPEDQEYTRQRLSQANNFLLFQQALDESNVRFRLQNSANQMNNGSPVGQVFASKADKASKSSLSVGSKLNSPGRKRRVRFSMDGKDFGVQQVGNRELKESYSVTALDLILYAINLLVQSLCNQLNHFDRSKSQLKLSVKLLMNSKRKMRSHQLTALARDIKSLNGVFLGVLGCLSQVFTVHLSKQVAGVLYGGGAIDSSRLQAYARRRILVFSQKVVFEVERKVLSQLGSQFLQLMLDLIVGEINLPPVELAGSVRDKSQEEVKRSRENLLNFLTSWLRLEPHDTSQQPEALHLKELNQSAPIQDSTLDTGAAGFKSSSRILNQMNNLEHLMAIQLCWLVEHLSGSPRQLVYLLQLIHRGLYAAFESLSGQLQAQLAQIGAPVVSGGPSIDSLNRSVDSISAKVRQLKCVHIFGSLDKLIRDIGDRHGVEELAWPLESKLKVFAETGNSSSSSQV